MLDELVRDSFEQREERTTLPSRHRRAEIWSCERPWWQVVLASSKENLSNRTGRSSQQVLMLGGDWSVGSGQVHLPSPLPSQILSPTVTGRAVVQESALALLTGHRPIVRRQSTGDKGALMRHGTCFLILSCSAATALNYSLIVIFAIMLEYFEMWRNGEKRKIATFIFKSKIK